MSIIKFILSAIASKFIKDNLPSLHYTEVIAGLKKAWAYITAFVFLVLVRMRVIKLSNAALFALIVIGIIAILAKKFNENQKLKPAIA